MKEAMFFMLFLCVFSIGYSQEYDLISTSKGDSIACRIDSITDAAVYLKMKYNNRWVHTNIRTDEVIEYKYSTIDKKAAIFRPGTSYIMLYDTPEAYLAKAQKLQRSGKIVTIAGVSTLGATVLSLVVFGDALDLAGVLVAFVGGSAGLVTMAVGIPMNAVGKNRAKRISSSKDTAFNGIALDLKPCAQYNLMTQRFQPGLTLKIRF